MVEFHMLKHHLGHDIECVMYGNSNITVECCTCNEVILSIDKDEDNVEQD